MESEEKADQHHRNSLASSRVVSQFRSPMVLFRRQAAALIGAAAQ